MRAIKQAVDLDPSPGQFVLTGSSNFLTVPTISESLAGRAGFVEVWPFTQGEVARTADRFIDGLFAGTGELGAHCRGNQLVETFVFAELRRQLTWAATDVTMYHWQDRAGAEVDLILEAADGRVAGLEVKSGHTPRPEWLRWLTQMRETLGDKFVAGVALYAGQQILPFGDRLLLAAPISTLWEL